MFKFNSKNIYLFLILICSSLYAGSILAVPLPNQTSGISPQIGCSKRIGEVIEKTFSVNNAIIIVPADFYTPNAVIFGVRGTLCPGIYQAFAVCRGIRTNNTCGGDSCGWDINLKNAAGNIIAYRSGHDGCTTSHSNTCESHEGTYSFWTEVGQIDTNTSLGLGNLTVYSENRWPWETFEPLGGTCTVSLTRIGAR